MERLEDIKEYWTMRAEGYSDSILDELRTDRHRRWLDLINRHIDGRALKVLDIGTGPGFFPILLGKEGHDVTAVDYTEAMLDKARSNCQEFGVPARLMRMDAQSLDLPDDAFDLILSRNLIWDLERPRQAYREWLRVLRPGGTMIVFDGNYYLHLYDEQFTRVERDKNDGHRFIKGVDVNIMKDIAKGLPLSRERRPQWDVNTLIELGASSIELSMDGDRVEYRSDEGETISLPFDFTLFVRK
ncbi:MAG: class I SAM-dependent methyltransferase [Methanomassiliicoccales archaeon]|nr:class I SAM-dependent methyltransferase [Methanomassiliicoccales archaeon]